MPFAACFSSEISFFLPSITSYLGVKSLSTSTAKSFLGKSLTWPKEALTRYCLPRYFPIVFAFAGDSTMTSDLARLTLLPAVQNEQSRRTLRRTLPFYHTLTKFLPGSCRTSPDIWRSKSAPINSDEETPSKDSRSVSSC